MPVIIEEESNQYGMVKWECIGIIDFLNLVRQLTVDEYMNWSEKHHPFRAFSASCMHTLIDYCDDERESMHAERVALLVPTERSNQDWNSLSTPYGKAVGGNRKRKLPCRATDKAVTKWQNSLPNGILAPEWIKGCSTLNELLAADQAAVPELYAMPHIDPK